MHSCSRRDDRERLSHVPSQCIVNGLTTYGSAQRRARMTDIRADPSKTHYERFAVPYLLTVRPAPGAETPRS